MARVVIPYKPRDQFKGFHQRKQRWAALVAHRRAGKTVAVVNELIKAALTCKLDKPRFAYLAPTHGQAKDVAWEYLKHFSRPIPGVQFHETELRVDYPNGARVRLYGAEAAERMRGLYLDGIALDEYADMDPRIWPEIIRPVLSDRKGWAVFIGTPKGRNVFADVCEKAEEDDDWFFCRLRASETRLLPDEELADAKREMTREQYAQEYECSFEASVVGAYYADELEQAKDRITTIPHDPAVSVRTYWDLGLDDATAVWFVQIVNREVRLIEYQEYHQALTEVAKDILSKPYAYERHILPHDAEVRELTTAKTRRSVIEGILGNKVDIAPKLSVEDGINATRVLFARMWFDAKKCARGLECLRNYRKQWDDKKKAFHDRPYHDWASHGADALRSLGVTFREQVKATTLKRRIPGIV